MNNWGFASFTSLTELGEKGFLEKDACIVGAEVFVCKSTHEKRVNQTVNLTTPLGSQTGQMKVKVPILEPERRGLSLDTLLPYLFEMEMDDECCEIVKSVFQLKLYSA
ncbi:hypothetical protein TSUD_341140 [Trifolium subterraneum]|uniref:MATH domain-containing protein n=1 Tax=Trifolium subterraneum TaxID=3900 RepID=A0A2Z6LJD6_TRISU|nr:hypothetical protein TSUD_341140 [Trifolium subterraneum]